MITNSQQLNELNSHLMGLLEDMSRKELKSIGIDSNGYDVYLVKSIHPVSEEYVYKVYYYSVNGDKIVYGWNSKEIMQSAYDVIMSVGVVYS